MFSCSWFYPSGMEEVKKNFLSSIKNRNKIWVIRACFLLSGYLFYYLIISGIHSTNTIGYIQTLPAIAPHRDLSVGLKPIVKKRPRNQEVSTKWCQKLRYQVPRGPVTALASFPGSGNTWVRYLIQQLTGMYTGSIYHDLELKKNGFSAEGRRDGHVIAIKTHSRANNQYDRLVLIVRDPYEALKAEFNRQMGGHIGHASTLNYRSKRWLNYVLNSAKLWGDFNLSWINAFSNSSSRKYILFYSQLKNDLRNELLKLGFFLTKKKPDDNILNCIVNRSQGRFKRKKKDIPFQIFSTKMNLTIEAEKTKILNLLQRTNL